MIGIYDITVWSCCSFLHYIYGMPSGSLLWLVFFGRVASGIDHLTVPLAG